MTSNAKSESSLPPPPESAAADCLLEAWREALADVLDTERRTWQRERALIEAQAQAVIATLRAEVTALRAESRDMIAAQLAQVRNGADGAPGPRGERGEPGEAGPQGARGEAGERGERGDAGPMGEAGPPGERGEQGAPGERGPSGSQGEPGQPGPQGERGELGPQGERGAQGDRGEQGLQGPDGAPGPGGERGERGAPGPAGERGEQGAPGRLSAVKPYVQGAVHYQGEVVTCDGSTWQARGDTAQPPPHTDWLCIAATGLDAPMPTIRGTYRDGEHYGAFDIVALNGSSFIARKAEPGACPGDGWQLIASAGKPGRPGPSGEKGQAGPRGLPGEPAPSIVGWTLDRAAYTATPIMSDGREGTPLELRGLFEQFQTDRG